MQNELSKEKNIGTVLAEKLREVDIHSIEELRAVGAENAYLRIKAIDETACLHMLSALEGAIEGVRKSELSPEKKEELRIFYNMEKKKQ